MENLKRITMTKDVILKILEKNKDSIMTSFNIGEEEINDIKAIMNIHYTNLGEAMDSIFASDLNGRGKMVAYYLIGYATGVIKVLTTESQ